MASIAFFLLAILLIGVLPLSIYLLRSMQQGRKRSGSLDEDMALRGEGAEAVEWWEERRSLFNRSLLAAGLFVIAFYYFLLQLRLASAELSFRFSWRNFLFLLVLYLIYMGIANLVYNVGVFAEQSRQPAALSDYRQRSFRLIYWAAIIAPFIFVLLSSFR